MENQTKTSLSKEDMEYLENNLGNLMNSMHDNFKGIMTFCKKRGREELFTKYIESAFSVMMHNLVSDEAVSLFLSRVLMGYWERNAIAKRESMKEQQSQVQSVASYIG